MNRRNFIQSIGATGLIAAAPAVNAEVFEPPKSIRVKRYIHGPVKVTSETDSGIEHMEFPTREDYAQWCKRYGCPE